MIFNVEWTYDNFENIHKLQGHLKESCRLSSDNYFSFEIFSKDAFVVLLPNLSAIFGATVINELNQMFIL